MDDRTTAISVLAVVAVLALASLVLLHVGGTGLYVYEQPSSNKPLIVQSSRLLENFDVCQQYLCTYPAVGYYGESEPAFFIGTETLSWQHNALPANVRCGCPDGREFVIRPDRIEEGTY